jgi:hypothetical protein
MSVDAVYEFSRYLRYAVLADTILLIREEMVFGRMCNTRDMNIEQ